jgi:hypothetical protein
MDYLVARRDNLLKAKNLIERLITSYERENGFCKSLREEYKDFCRAIKEKPISFPFSGGL